VPKTEGLGGRMTDRCDQCDLREGARVNVSKTPWPWFGGKADAAEIVWSALGDVDHYVEPFAGSLAVLLRRPHVCNRTYHSETVNDLDGLLCNAWRAMQMSPDEMADAASWPVCEADMHARHLALLRWREERNLERLMADPAWHDPVMAGWWAWGQSCWIGNGWCSGEGPWIVGDDGRICKRDKVAREPGVSRQLPRLGNDGQGANRPQLREPGVSRQLPDLGNDGKGVNHAGTREPGVAVEHEYHPMTMPELRRWFAFLSARLRHVRILNGDWTRAVTNGATKTISVRQGGHAGIFFDPPYGAVRADSLYACEDLDVAVAVRTWCIEHGGDPKFRIVLAGYDTEHTDLDSHGWRCIEWFRSGFLKGGMGNTGGSENHQQKRERLWLSPHCLHADDGGQMSLLEGGT
jgi:DNA adenine methylase